MISLFDLPAFLGVDFEEESHNVNDVRKQRSDDRQFGRPLHAELFWVVLLQMLLQRGSEREGTKNQGKGGRVEAIIAKSSHSSARVRCQLRNDSRSTV